MSKNESSSKQSTKELRGWCESESCGLPIYEGTAYKSVTSEKGNTYFYCKGCEMKSSTPDEEEREED